MHAPKGAARPDLQTVGRGCGGAGGLRELPLRRIRDTEPCWGGAGRAAACGKPEWDWFLFFIVFTPPIPLRNGVMW